MSNLGSQSKQELNMTVKRTKVHFDTFKQTMKITKANEPLTDGDSEIGLYNPYSKITCIILYIYSMEFGTPPLYTELNRVAREMDLK